MARQGHGLKARHAKDRRCGARRERPKMPRRSNKVPSATTTAAWAIDAAPGFQRKLNRVAWDYATTDLRAPGYRGRFLGLTFELRKIVSDYVFAAQDENSAAKVA